MIAALIGLMALFLLGGGSGFMNDFQKGVKDQIEDKPRQEALLDQTKAFQKQQKEVAEGMNDHFEALQKVHLDYDSQAEDFEAVIKALQKDHEHRVKINLEINQTIRKSTTPDEWKKIMASDK